MDGPFQIICWQRGYYGVVDTRYPIGDPRRGGGAGSRGFKRKSDAMRYVR